MHRNKVPGYQGFIPQVKAENAYGSTYGNTTKQQKDGQIKAGFDCDNKDRFRSQNQNIYTEQMSQKVFGTGMPQQAQGGLGELPLDFETAKNIAIKKRQEQFEVNKRNFFGEDGWKGGEYKASTNNFWGC